MKSREVAFENEDGVVLRGTMELPLESQPKFYALFAHCFTCGKDLRVARNLSLSLTQEGIAVLRFDFTGLGESDGDFADSNFSANTRDLLAAADFLKEHYQSPSLLIGHSLGGTASLQVAAELDSVKALATIGAPYNPDHVLNLLKDDLETLKEDGEATVDIGGRNFRIRQQFVEDLRNRVREQSLRNEAMRGKSLLIMHSPQDAIVEISNARKIYEEARHPKSFVSLDGANHLLTAREDSIYAGKVIATWAGRYISVSQETSESEEMVMARIDEGPFLTEILAGEHHMLADEPESVGGDDLGPNPYQFLAAGLGACTAMTLRMYADRKKWPLTEVKVHLNYDNDYEDHARNCENMEKRMGRFERMLEIKGDLEQSQVDKLVEIANKCPVHKTMEKGVSVETSLREGPAS